MARYLSLAIAAAIFLAAAVIAACMPANALYIS